MKADELRRMIRQQPLAAVRWVKPSELRANRYNPNKVFGPEMDLLKLSILENGWTQPIVATPDGEIVDGFHRWKLGSTDPDVKALTGGLVPVVRVVCDKATQIAATVRHNRARGSHGIIRMGVLVRSLREQGLNDSEIARRLGMHKEEIGRLSETRGMPELAGGDAFSKGWVPDPES